MPNSKFARAIQAGAQGFFQMSGFMSQQKQSAMQQEMTQMQMDNYESPEQRRQSQQEQFLWEQGQREGITERERERVRAITDENYPIDPKTGKGTMEDYQAYDPYTDRVVNDPIKVFKMQQEARKGQGKPPLTESQVYKETANLIETYYKDDDNYIGAAAIPGFAQIQSLVREGRYEEANAKLAVGKFMRSNDEYRWVNAVSNPVIAPGGLRGANTEPIPLQTFLEAALLNGADYETLASIMDTAKRQQAATTSAATMPVTMPEEPGARIREAREIERVAGQRTGFTAFGGKE